jgi:nicotinamide-nucleotide amidase
MRIGRTTLACLPGVPSEMKLMFHEQVVPRLRRAGWIDRVLVHRKINLFGKGEADIEAQALDLTVRGRIPEVGITAHEATISFRITASGASEEEARSLIEPTVQLIYDRFGSLVLGEDQVDVPESLVAELVRTGTTLATAESCTGGVIAHLITAIAGVSPYYVGGVVSYANSAKRDVLGVPAGLLEAHGAVSSEVAAAMAQGVRERLGADLGLSTTGVAGPAGGTPEKPVGLVYLGLATAERTQTRRIDIGADQPRDIIQHRSSKAALNWARLILRER